ncbi:MAG TPA: acyl-CoA thioesterase, partial [Brevundimonas sp.]
MAVSDEKPIATLPEGQPVGRVIAMPADTNPEGDIFGGWLLAQMDLAG